MSDEKNLLDCGPMTDEVIDNRPGIYEAVQDARAALRGWNNSRVRRTQRYLRKLAKLSWSHRGANLVERKKDRLFLNRLTNVQLLAIQILSMVERFDVERAREQHARLREEVLRPDALFGASRRRQVRAWSQKGAAVRRKYSPADHARWDTLAAGWHLERSPSLRELAPFVASAFGDQSAKESIRHHLMASWRKKKTG